MNLITVISKLNNRHPEIMSCHPELVSASGQCLLSDRDYKPLRCFSIGVGCLNKFEMTFAEVGVRVFIGMTFME